MFSKLVFFKNEEGRVWNAEVVKGQNKFESWSRYSQPRKVDLLSIGAGAFL